MYKRLTQQRGTHVLAGLQRTYETILGEKKRLEQSEYGWEGVEGYHQALDYWRKAESTLNNLLKALETTILLFDPNWDRSTVRPKVRQLTPKLVIEPSGVVASMFRALRQAHEPMTVAGIAAKVAADLKLKAVRRDQRQRLYAAVHSALKRYRAKEIVTCLGGRPARWSLVEKGERAA